MYQAIPKQFPNVVFINWFSVDAASDGLAYNDYAVTTDEVVLDSYRQAIDAQYFLTQLPAHKPPHHWRSLAHRISPMTSWLS